MKTSALKIVKETARMLKEGGWVLSSNTAAFVVLEKSFSMNESVVSLHRLMFNLSFPKSQLPSDDVHGIIVNLSVEFPGIEKAVSDLAEEPVRDLTFMVGAIRLLPADSLFAGAVLLIDSSISSSEATRILFDFVAPFLSISEAASNTEGLLDPGITSLVSKQFFWEERQLAHHWIARDEKSIFGLIDDIEAKIADSDSSADVLDFGREEASIGRLRKMISNIRRGQFH